MFPFAAFYHKVLFLLSLGLATKQRSQSIYKFKSIAKREIFKGTSEASRVLLFSCPETLQCEVLQSESQEHELVPLHWESCVCNHSFGPCSLIWSERAEK